MLAGGLNSVRSAMSVGETVLARNKLRQERHGSSLIRGHDMGLLVLASMPLLTELG